MCARNGDGACAGKSHTEEVRGGGGAVEMADEPVLETIAGRRKLEAKAVYLVVRKGGEIPGESGVVLEHVEAGHADDGGCDGQAQRVAQQGIDIGLAGGAAEKEFLAGDLHGDSAEIFGFGSGEGELFKTAVARGVERHLHTIEIVALNGGGQDFTAGVAGHADEAREFLFAGLEEAFEGAIRRLDFFEIVGLAEAVDVDEIDMIGLQTRETAFEAPEEGVTGAVENLRGEPDVFATRGHHLANTGFALAVPVSVSGVKISDA